jgi:hypothetical protein
VVIAKKVPNTIIWLFLGARPKLLSSIAERAHRFILKAEFRPEAGMLLMGRRNTEPRFGPRPAGAGAAQGTNTTEKEGSAASSQNDQLDTIEYPEEEINLEDIPF